jgi:hypothetical protein
MRVPSVFGSYGAATISPALLVVVTTQSLPRPIGRIRTTKVDA